MIPKERIQKKAHGLVMKEVGRVSPKTIWRVWEKFCGTVSEDDFKNCVVENLGDYLVVVTEEERILGPGVGVVAPQDVLVVCY